MVTLLPMPGLVNLASAKEPPTLEWAPVVELRERVTGERGSAELAQRARVGIEATRAGVSARVTIQDVRRWPGDAAGPELAEGSVQLRGELSRNIGVRFDLGRQAIAIHDGRLVGGDDFSMGGRFFDAVRVRASARPVEIEYIHASGTDPLGPGLDVVRVGGSASGPLATWVADAIWALDARDSRTTSTQGAYARVDAGRWRSRAEAYLQADESLLAVSGGRVFGPNERWIVSLSCDAASDGWRPLSGDSHRFFGLAGRFATPPPTGVADLAARVEARPAPQIEASLALHRFWSPTGGGPFGSEADAALEWWFSPLASIGGGAAWFVPSPEFDPEARRYGYLEVDVRF